MGGESAEDGTMLLREVMRQIVSNALVVLSDADMFTNVF